MGVGAGILFLSILQEPLAVGVVGWVEGLVVVLHAEFFASLKNVNLTYTTSLEGCRFVYFLGITPDTFYHILL